MLPEVLDPDAAAKLVGCAVTTLEEHARSGHLPGVKLGRQWVFPTANLLRELNERATAEAAQRRADIEAERERAERTARRAKRRPAIVAFHARKRRAKKLQRTPPWANMRAILVFYEEAARLTAETGAPHHVDHVIPLQGRLVSGLHVETNMQILTGVDNIRKRNRFEVE